MMKNKKILLLISIEVVIILMARWIFIHTSKVAEIANEKGFQESIASTLQSLHILQAIILFACFIVVFAFIIKEYLFMKTTNNATVDNEVADITENTQKESEEKEKREAEEALRKQQQMEKKRNEIHNCVEAAFKNFTGKPEKARSEKLLSCLAGFYEIAQAEIFLRRTTDETDKLYLSAAYAIYVPEEKVFEFEMGEGLIGQVAKAGEPINMANLPEGYITIKSGLGSANPSHLALIPWDDSEGKTFAVLELASFKPFDSTDIDILVSIREKVREIYG